MKTIPIKEAYAKATKGPLKPYRIKSDFIELNGPITTAATIDHDIRDTSECNATAALLAHAFNTLPEVVEACAEFLQYRGIDGHVSLCRCSGCQLMAVLAKASTVQMP